MSNRFNDISNRAGKDIEIIQERLTGLISAVVNGKHLNL